VRGAGKLASRYHLQTENDRSANRSRSTTSGAQTGKRLLGLSVTGFDPDRPWAGRIWRM
jgi:hypothetical protein